jgi:hypothetical protein
MRLLIIGDHVTQPLGGDLDHLAAVAHHGRQVRRRTREQVQLPKEAVPPMDGDDSVLTPVPLDDRDGAGLDHEEVVASVTGTEQDLSGLDLARLADCAETVPLRAIQSREGAVAVDRLLHAHPEHRAHSELTISSMTSST